MNDCETVIPGRLRQFEQTQIHTPWIIKKVLGREFAPNTAEYAALKQGLFAGDDAMDCYVQARIQASPQKPDWQEFHQALQTANPLEFQGSNELRILIQNTFINPNWVDWQLMDEGVQFIQSTGRAATDVLRDMALMGGYLMVAFNKTLILTGELEKGAAPRLASTAQWWLKVVNTNANHAGGLGAITTLRVRWMHALVRHQLRNSPQWDSNQWGLPINQVDMAATYLGFSAVMLLGLRKMGIVVTARNSRSVMQLWKLIGWQMGVQEKWLVDTEQEALVALRQFLFTHSPPDESTQRLASALAGEPLSRNYSNFQTLRRKFAHHKHLSSSWYLLGPGMFYKLGLKAPWGPFIALMMVPLRAATHLAQRCIPLISKRQILQGRRAQEIAVAELHQRQVAQSKTLTSMNAS
ncbi:oxygenase MpaB family protein [Limnobacter parvus]|uniref:DUF2236 domain-containing protein n=1 Tax=Limnobacter parvus TaxID=2939690 RepID=A0ABT1XKA4_9BURK|nr:oxygenase MpaB family protein [Limnobacter parvus]MCR2746524.1 DUF2236 domain-containing protein [Limnobacter parvus]